MSLELLKFEADWCGPCQQQSEILEGFDTVPVELIDVDENQMLAGEYGVMSIPTLVLENDGEEVERWTGLTQVGEIEDAVSRYI